MEPENNTGDVQPPYDLSSLEELARRMIALSESEIEFIRQKQPERDVAQIILMIGIRINNLEIVRWALGNYPHLALFCKQLD